MDSETAELAIAEKQLKRMEDLVFGTDKNRSDGDQLLDGLLAVSNKLGYIASKSEKISTVMKRADELKKYSDPLYAESDTFVPETVKYQLIMSEEEKLQEAVQQFEKLEELKPCLDSQAIADVPKLESQLTKLASIQASQQEEVDRLTTQTYSLLQTYSDLVNSISVSLAEIDSKSSK